MGSIPFVRNSSFFQRIPISPKSLPRGNTCRDLQRVRFSGNLLICLQKADLQSVAQSVARLFWERAT